MKTLISVRCSNFLFSLVVVSTLLVGLHSNEAKGGAHGSSQRLGAGLAVGTIDSLTGKYRMANGNAFDFGLAFAPSPWTVIYGDYLWQRPGIFGASNGFIRQLTGYIGVGGGLSFASRSSDCYRYSCGTAYKATTTGLFLRGFFGAEWLPEEPPLGIFAEIGPAIGIIPGLGGSIDLEIGLRYFF